MDNKDTLGADNTAYESCSAEFIKNTDIETAIKYYNRALADKGTENDITEHAKEIVQAFFAKLSQLPEIIMMYNQKVSSILPIIDLTGAAWFFTDESYAKEAVLKNGGQVEYKTIDNNQLNLLIRYEFQRFGIRRIKINPTSEADKSAAVSFAFAPENFCTESFGEGNICDNSNVYSAILRYLQISSYSAEGENAAEHADNLKRILFTAVRDAVFLVPMRFDEDGEKYNNDIHYTVNTEQFIKGTGKRYRFFSTEKNKWADKATVKTVHFSTVQNSSGQTFLPIFTDLIEFNRLIKDKSSFACAVTFRELIGYIIGDCRGIVINCAGLSYTVTSDMLDFKTRDFAEAEDEDDEELVYSPAKETLAQKKLYILMCADNPLLINDEYISVFTTAKHAQAQADTIKSDIIRIIGIEPKNLNTVFSHYKLLFGINSFILNGADDTIFAIDDYFDIIDISKEPKNDIEGIKNPALKKALIIHEQYSRLRGKADKHDPVKSVLLYNVLSELDNARLIAPAAKNDQGVSIPMMKSAEGEMLIPVFTDFIHLMKVHEKIKFTGAAAYKSQFLAESIEGGFAVNPGGSEAAVLSREMVCKFYETKGGEKSAKSCGLETAENESAEDNAAKAEPDRSSVFGKFKDAYKRFRK